MFYRGRVKPSKGASLFGMIIGGIFVLLGVTAVLPTFGWFGIIWLLIAIGITVMHGINFFSNRGLSSWEVDVETRSNRFASPASRPAPRPSSAPQPQQDFESKLRKLERLKADGILTEEEYQLKRSQIIQDKW